MPFLTLKKTRIRLRHRLGARGRRYTSFGLPGTGLSYRKSGGGCLILIAAIPSAILHSRWLLTSLT